MLTVNSLTREQLQTAVDRSTSIAEVLRFLNLPVNSGKYPSIKNKAAELGVVLPEWDNRLPANQSIVKLTDAEFFKEDSRRSGSSIRKRLLDLGWEYKCSNPACGLEGKTVWAGKPIVFQVDHVDGNNRNNQISNLRFLCPNCHSQTETYGKGHIKREFYCLCGRKSKVENGYCVHTADQTQIPYLGTKKGFKKCSCGNDMYGSSQVCFSCRKENNKVYSPIFPYPPVEEIVENIEAKGYSAYSKELGISDNGLRKHLRQLRVNPLPKKLSKRS